MSGVRASRVESEQGAALILAIAFLLVVSGISAAVISTITSGLNDRTSLDQARNREYSADAAIETSIARLQMNPGGCGATDVPFSFNDPLSHDPNRPVIHVDCVSTPTTVITTDSSGTLSSFLQNDVTFTACAPRPSANANYMWPAAGALVVDSTSGFLTSGVVNVSGATQGVFAYTGINAAAHKFTGVTTIQAGSGLSGPVTQGCSAATTIINARINFQGTVAPLATFVQAWSVNG